MIPFGRTYADVSFLIRMLEAYVPLTETEIPRDAALCPNGASALADRLQASAAAIAAALRQPDADQVDLARPDRELKGANHGAT